VYENREASVQGVRRNDGSSQLKLEVMGKKYGGGREKLRTTTVETNYTKNGNGENGSNIVD